MIQGHAYDGRVDLENASEDKKIIVKASSALLLLLPIIHKAIPVSRLPYLERGVLV